MVKHQVSRIQRLQNPVSRLPPGPCNEAVKAFRQVLLEASPLIRGTQCAGQGSELAPCGFMIAHCAPVEAQRPQIRA